MFGVVDEVRDGIARVIVDGGSEALEVLSAKSYAPAVGDRVTLERVGGRYVIAYGVGIYIGTSCAVYGRIGDYVSAAADYLPLNSAGHNNALPGTLDSAGRIGIHAAGLYSVGFHASLTGSGTVRARIVRQDALGKLLGSGNWETVVRPGMVHAAALFEVGEMDYIVLHINGAFTALGDSVQATVFKVR